MISVEEALMTRLTGDSSGTGNLQTLLGGSGRILHALGPQEPKMNSVVYNKVTGAPSPSLFGDNAQAHDEFFMFTIYHDQYETVKDRIYQLLNGYRFPALADGLIKACVWDWEGPDEFDEALKVGVARVRYKVSVARSAQSPL